MERPKTKDILKQMFAIGIPIALQNLISVGVGFVDIVMIGNVGEAQLGGVAQANRPYFFFTMFIFGIATGAVVISARYWGNRDVKSIRRITGLTMRICLVLGVLSAATVLIFPEAVMKIFADDPEVIRYGMQYLEIIGWTYVFSAFTGAFLTSLRGIGDVRASMFIYAISCLMNVFLNWVFIFGNLGMPRMDVRGAALATAICRLTEVVLTLCYMYFGEHQLNYRLKYIFAKTKEYWGSLLRYGVPVLLSESTWGIGMTVQSAIIGHLGVNVLAAYSVVYVIQDLSGVLIIGFVNAAMIILSNLIGAGDDASTKHWAKVFSITGCGLGLVMASAILLLRPFAPGFIIASPETAKLILDMMIVSAWLMFWSGLSWNLGGGILRGGGDTRFCAILDVGFFIIIKLGVGLLGAFVFHMDPVLLYFLLCSDEFIKGILSALRIRQGKWIHKGLSVESGPVAELEAEAASELDAEA